MFKWLAMILLCILCFLESKVVAYEHEISIMAIFKNEADYLHEWIEYHRRIGVDHFLLFNHNSEDQYLLILQPYVEKGIVELVDWKQVEFPAAQFNAYAYGIKWMQDKTKWLAVIDIDEFIVPQKHDNLKNFLKKFEPYAGVVINWQLFGTSNIQSLPKGEWITKHLVHKFPTYFDDSWSSNCFVKSIIRPDRIDPDSKDPQCGNHVFMPLSNYHLVNPNRKFCEPKAKQKKVLVDKICINHYWFRTLDWFYSHKIARREGLFFEQYPQEKIDYLLEMGLAEKDLSIQRFLP